MCGRFTLTLDAATLQSIFRQFIIPAEVQPRYNIAPGQPILAVPNGGERRAEHFLWGLVPSWAKDPRRYRFINARAETAAQKPAFRAAFRRRRCLVVADGFYEWQGSGKQRRPHYFTLQGQQPFAIAALWETWQGPHGEELDGCALLTTQANAVVAPVHARMPVILPPEAFAAWLTPGEVPPQHLQSLLKPFPAEAMQGWPVSTEVNSPHNDAPHLIAAATP